jgi:hypothetical protein
MAITSISRMQQRRGVRSDLPLNLAEAEFGWCLDTQELFIGNGPGYGGNTQILTQWSPNGELITYRFSGSDGSIAGTGPSGTYIYRSLNAVLDDAVSVKAYGAVGDGVADDTDAINRAIADRYGTSWSKRNRIYFPPGRYRITSPMLVRPYTYIFGNGPGHTEIYMDDPSAITVIETADSLGQTGMNLGLGGAVMPTSIIIEGMTVTQTTENGDGIRLNRCDNVWLNNIHVEGAWQTFDGPGPGSTGIRVVGQSVVYTNPFITITQSKISDFVYGIKAGSTGDYCSYLRVNGCQFHHCYNGFVGGSGLSYSKISMSTFRTIHDIALILEGTESVVSASNDYIDVAIDSGTYSISWDAITNNCASIGDSFNCSIADRILDGNPSNNLINNAPSGGGGGGGGSLTVFGPITLLDNQVSAATSITMNTALKTAAVMEYSINRGSTRKIGRLQLITDGSTANIIDTGIDLGGSTGVTFGYSISGGILTILYSTTNTGTSGYLKYTMVSWLA